MDNNKENGAIGVHEAMTRVMRDVTSLGKNQDNKHQGFKFRGIDDVMQVFGPAMRKHGLRCVPINMVTKLGDKQLKNSVAKTVDVVVDYRWYGPDGSYIDSQMGAESFDSGDKATAKAMSVALRTLFLQVFCLPTDELDPDSYTYEISLTDKQKKFLDEVNRETDKDRLKAMWSQGQQLGLEKYVKARAQELGFNR
ncbi:ERF family protein [Corynebacterium auriscanis]|uniref:ERF family protein n=1 Tax=Corynebacterium auriscanis TaxID=99807 RepID=UPI003CE67159